MTAVNAQAKGFTYPVLLVFVITTSVMAGVAQKLTSTFIKREKEKELLFIGAQYVDAIESYYENGKRFPRSLDDLVRDPRFVNKRHLRKLYKDPFAKGDEQWSILRNSEGGIIGVASNSISAPLKTANFPTRFTRFIGASQYSEWVFEYIPEPSLRFKEGFRTTP